MDPSTQDSLDVLWAQVLEAWTDDKRHQAFLAYCVEADRLPEAARRYKQVADEVGAREGYRADSSRGEDAQRRLGGIAILAMARLEQQRKPVGPSRVLVVAKVFAAVFLLTALAALTWALTLR